MNLAGYTVLVERGRWVDQDKLHHPANWEMILSRLSHLIQNPDYPAYLQRHDLKRIRRIRLEDLRLYCRLFPSSKILCLLACVGRGEVKRDEVSGALDYQFVNYLRPHNEEFIPDRFVPLEKRAPKVVEKREETYTAPVLWCGTFSYVPLSQDEAMHLLSSTRPSRGRFADFKMTPFCEDVIKRVERAFDGDKILVPLPGDGKVWKREEVVSLQAQARHALKFFGKTYSINFDSVAQKIVLCPPDKKDVFLYRRGGRTKSRWDYDLPGRV